MVVKAGRFGEYVTDGEYNATLRKDDTVEAITLERAAELLAERRAKGPAKKAAKKGAKKAPGQEVDRQEDRGEEDDEEGRGQEVLSAGRAAARGSRDHRRRQFGPRSTRDSPTSTGASRSRIALVC